MEKIAELNEDIISKSSKDNNVAQLMDGLPFLIEKCSQDQAGVLDLTEKLSGANIEPNSGSQLSRSLNKLETLAVHLNTLSLRQNRLKALPHVFRQLSNLQVIDLSSNSLQQIPPVLQELPLLQELYLEDNQIESISEQFCQGMKALEVLDISRNRLSDLPACLSQVVNLKTLLVHNNQISIIPNELSELKHLASIKITGNPLTSPPLIVAEKGSRVILQYLREHVRGSKSQPKHRSRGETQASSLSASQTHQFVGILCMDVSPTGLTSIDLNEKWMKATLLGDTTEIDHDASITDKKIKTTGMNSSSLHLIEHLVAEITGSDTTAVEETNAAPKDHIMWSRNSRKNAQKLFTILAEVREVRRQLSHGHGTQASLIDEQLSFDLFEPSLNFDTPFKLFEREMSTLTNEIIQNVKNANASPLLVLSQRRNISRTNYVMAIHDRLSTLKSDLLEWRGAEQETTDNGIVATATAYSKRTNELMDQLIQALTDEATFLEKNASKIHREYKNRRKIIANKEKAYQQIRAYQKLYYYLQQQLNIMSQTVTQMELSELLRSYTTLSQTSPKDETIHILRKHLASIRHKFLQVAETDYPELAILYKEQMIKANSVPILPQSAFKLHDYTDLIFLNREKTFFLGKNPYGENCRIRLFPLTESTTSKFGSATEFIYSVNKRNIISLRCCWIEGETAYVEEPAINAPTLREWLYNTLDISFDVARNIILDILSSLAVLHRSGFVWGALTPDSILIENGPDGVPIPVLTGFDYGYSSDPNYLTECDPPESHVKERKFLTVSADLFALGVVASMILSSSRSAPEFNNETISFQIPQIAPKLNSKHLFLFLMQLITKHPDRRCHAGHLLLHPYFTIDRSPIATGQQNVQISPTFKNFISNLYHKRKVSSGIMIAEVDVTVNLVQQFMDIFYQTPDPDMIKPFIPVTLKESTVFIDPITMFFRQLLAFKDFLQPTRTDHSSKDKTARWYMPSKNSRIHLSYYQAMGRLLCKLVVDGYPVPTVFPVAFFKLLTSRSCSMADLESCDPKLAVQFYLNPKLKDDLFLQGEVDKFFIHGRQLQFNSIQEGFYQANFDLQKLSPLELVDLFYGKTNDELCGNALLSYVVFDGFVGPEDMQTVEFFWMWINSLDITTLRQFLLFTSGHYTLPTNILVPEKASSCPRRFMEGKTVPTLIFIHRVNKRNIYRPFVHHLELPIFSDFNSFKSNITSMMDDWLRSEGLSITLQEAIPIATHS